MFGYLLIIVAYYSFISKASDGQAWTADLTFSQSVVSTALSFTTAMVSLSLKEKTSGQRTTQVAHPMHFAFSKTTFFIFEFLLTTRILHY